MRCENVTCRSIEIINFLYISIYVVVFLLEKAYILKSHICGIKYIVG